MDERMCQCPKCEHRFAEAKATQWPGELRIFCPRCGWHIAALSDGTQARSRWWHKNADALAPYVTIIQREMA